MRCLLRPQGDVVRWRVRTLENVAGVWSPKDAWSSVESMRREIVAVCRGDSGEIHRLGYRDSRWWCECPAKTQCAHLYALQLVCVGPVGAWVDLNDLLRREAEIGS